LTERQVRTFDDIARAVYRKDLTAIRDLRPDEVNLTDADGRTPLIHAVLAEDAAPAVVKALIERGAKVDVADREQQWTALHFAARDQNEPIMRLLLERGAALDPADAFGNTPLWRSVMNTGESLAVPKLLLEHGADPNRKNRSGKSPLDVARDSGQEELVELFERRSGAGPQAVER
jgi:ankyrin repeat protein